MKIRTAVKRPPREILKSLDNKENNPLTIQHKSRQISIVNRKIETECNTVSSKTPVRGRLIVFPTYEKAHSQKNKTDDSVNNDYKRYLSTKESINTNHIRNTLQTIQVPNYNTLQQAKTTILIKDAQENLNKLFPQTCEPFNYNIGPVIGKGSYAVVKLGTDQSGKKVAIKIYDKNLLKGERLNNLVKEVSTLRMLNHDQIVKLYDIFHQGQTINLVLEYCGTESLFTLLKTSPSRCIQRDIAIGIIHQLLKILLYIHDRNICHRDIKLENILIQNKRIKLIDFGFSTFSNQQLTCHCGTPSYMSPEVTLKLKYDGRAVDIWALGVLFVGLIQGCFPFKGQNERELFRKIRNNEHLILTLDKDIRQFLNHVFVLDPTQRSTAKEVFIMLQFFFLKLLQLDLFRS